MKTKYRILALLATTFFIKSHGQWTYPNSNTISTTDEVVAPVFLSSNEIRIANSFVATDPSIGTMDNSHYGINLHKTNGIGFAFNGIHQMVFKPNGDTGIGTASPQSRLHVSTATSGDAVLLIEADTNNSNESNNSRIQLLQDGGLLGAYIGFENTWGGPEPDNIFRIGTRRNGIDFYNNLTINTATNYVGVGTATPTSKLHISTETSGDAILRIEADTDNNNENDNPGIHFVQDGALVTYFVEVEGQANTKSTGTTANALIIGSESSNRDIQLINGDQVQMTVKNSGVGIGTIDPDGYKLAVKGKIRAEEIKVETGWADYVFKEDYDLPTLDEVEKHIKEKGHLINIPSAKEVEENGVQLGEMNKLLLEKIEELTLYVIELKKENEAQNIIIEKLLNNTQK
ncbi:hypothetical protein MTsPCn5_16410 [Croceitalea sp. MTPC5]|uniref:hypothetical protein n=1 Tax=Croceitalea sp. MTPC5 TaxID=3056565 RepID=UPI002B388DE6|nr:hypothetical protein MTsPCn5_16410 [Croceitalea sp. MTPC5]